MTAAEMSGGGAGGPASGSSSWQSQCAAAGLAAPGHRWDSLEQVGQGGRAELEVALCSRHRAASGCNIAQRILQSWAAPLQTCYPAQKAQAPRDFRLRRLHALSEPGQCTRGATQTPNQAPTEPFAAMTLTTSGEASPDQAI